MGPQLTMHTCQASANHTSTWSFPHALDPATNPPQPAPPLPAVRHPRGALREAIPPLTCHWPGDDLLLAAGAGADGAWDGQPPPPAAAAEEEDPFARDWALR